MLETLAQRRDSLGWRKTFAVIAPSTNTSVQPEFDDMRPRGVTNHYGRIDIPNDPVHNDDDFNRMMGNIRTSMEQTVRSVLTCEPDVLVMGMSSETFWDGLEGSQRLRERMEELAARPVVMGSDAVQKALRCYGDVKRIGVVTPYFPVGDAQVIRFFTDCGFEVVNLHGFKCDSPVNIARVSARELRDAFLAVNDPATDVLVQVGTNLACARVAAMAEFWLDKPVLAINTAIYWDALRSSGIDDKIEGFGSLLSTY